MSRDKLLTDCCERCEAYCGFAHNFNDPQCQECPVMELYKKYNYLKRKDELRGWDEPKPWKQEMGCNQYDARKKSVPCEVQ